MSDNPILNKKPSEEELRGYRHQKMEQIAKLVEGPRALHLFDALHVCGLPRALFLANMNDPVIRAWYDASVHRALIHAPGEMPDLETIRDRNAQGIAAGGLGEKLTIMTALADPTTVEGAEMLLKIADLQAKWLPKTTKVQNSGPSIEDSKVREELAKIRKEREMLLDMQEQATDANSDG